MKVSSKAIYTRSRDIPSVKFSPAENLTSFGGLVVFMPLFQRLVIPPEAWLNAASMDTEDWTTSHRDLKEVLAHREHLPTGEERRGKRLARATSNRLKNKPK